MKLLIVEDNAAVRRVIRSIVASVADDIHECADGSDALQYYRDWHPDFVLMDIEMKRVDGITATQQIVASDPMAKIVIVTNYDDVVLRDAAQKAGACGYIVKENLLEIPSLLHAISQSNSPESPTNL